MSKLRSAFVVVSIGWFALIPLATFLAGRASPQPSAGYGLALGTYVIGSLVCHQRPERSFHLLGVQMPVCARCLGIYAGAAAAAALLWLFSDRRSQLLRHESAISWPGFGVARHALLVSAIPIAATLAYEWTTGDTPANWIRAVSGLSLGAAVAWIVCTVESGHGRVDTVN
jgi:Predicted membrane protein (DUF2085)